MMQPMQPMQQPMQQQAHAAAAGGAQNQAQEDSDSGDNIVVAQRVMVNGRWVFAAVAPELAAGEREQNIRRAEVMEANVVGYPGADDGQRMRGHTVPDVAMGGDAEADELAEDEMDLAIEQDTHTAEMTATEENAAEHAVDQNEIDWAQDTVSLAQQVTQAAGAVNIGNGALPALHTPAAQHNAGPAQDVPTGRPGRSVVSAETRRQESLGDARNRSTNWHIMTASALRRTPPPPAPPSSPGLPTPPPPPPPQPRPEPRTCACCVADFGVVTVNDRGHYHVEPELAEWYCKKCHFMVHKECQQMWLLNAIQRNHAGSCLNWYVFACFFTRVRASC